MSNKKVNFYYSTPKKDGTTTIYKCLYDDSDEVIETLELNYKQHKNMRMNDKFTACDEDLFEFRDALIKYNDENKKPFFKNKEKKVFKIDVFNYNTINDAVYNNVIMNADQRIINAIPDVKFKEFCVFENCLSCGLMSIDKDILEKPVDCHGVDYVKFYYEMMKKIRIPISAPEFYVLDELNFDDLCFAIYRVKIICNNKQFLCFR
jgi:hypothetical protein